MPTFPLLLTEAKDLCPSGLDAAFLDALSQSISEKTAGWIEAEASTDLLDGGANEVEGVPVENQSGSAKLFCFLLYLTQMLQRHHGLTYTAILCWNNGHAQSTRPSVTPSAVGDSVSLGHV